MNIDEALAADQTKLGQLFQAEEDNLWAIGDQINHIMQTYPSMTLSKLGEMFGRSTPRLSRISLTARTYKKEDRIAGVCFYSYELAREAEKRTTRELGLHLDRKIEPDYKAAIQHVIKNKITDQREATSSLAQKSRIRLKAELPKRQDHSDIVKCHHADCSTWLNSLEDGSVKIIGMDPPYGQYTKIKGGSLDTSTSAVMTDSDNTEEEDAIEVTVESIKNAAPKLARGGCILLWQAAKPLRIRIHQAILDSGLEVDSLVVWNKGRHQPMDFSRAYAIQAELMYVLKRKGGMLLNHDSSDRGNVLNITPVQFSAADMVERHWWEKPMELTRLLIGKHSHSGELVVECFGGSGSLARAAIEMDRQWVYIEQNETVFALGKERIADQLDATHRTRQNSDEENADAVPTDEQGETA